MEISLAIKMCSICLNANKCVFDLFHISGYDSQGNIVPINEMLSFCSSIKLNPNLVSLICVKCVENTMVSYNFVKQFKKNYERLDIANLAKKKSNVKEQSTKVIQKGKKRRRQDVYKIYQNDDYKHKKSEHICPVCNSKLLTYASFEEHMQLHRQETDCLLCDKEFTNSAEFLVHYAAEHYNLCKVCHVVFDTKLQFQQHRHLAKPPNILKNSKPTMPAQEQLDNGDNALEQPAIHVKQECEDERLLQPAQITSSIDIVKYLEKDPEKHECPSCGKQLNVYADFLRHVGNSHKTQSITCQFCIVIFSNTDDYLLHYDRRHYNYCEICNVPFTHRSKFIAHWRKHLRNHRKIVS